MRLLLFFPLIALAGCAALLGNTPSVEYCNDVTYTRHGNQVNITAVCSLPIGGGLLSVPIPK